MVINLLVASLILTQTAVPAIDYKQVHSQTVQLGSSDIPLKSYKSDKIILMSILSILQKKDEIMEKQIEELEAQVKELEKDRKTKPYTFDKKEHCTPADEAGLSVCW
jgi:hypothetical protein